MINACMSIEPVPLCYRCQSPMEVRTRRQEPKAGTKFLGCSSWPITKCDFTLSLLGEGSEGEGGGRAFSVLSEDEFHARLPQPTQRRRISRARAKLFEWLHKMHRRRLESDEPDATGAWEPKHRRSVVRYVHDRDGGRCGLCGAKMKIKGVVGQFDSLTCGFTQQTDPLPAAGKQRRFEVEVHREEQTGDSDQQVVSGRQRSNDPTRGVSAPTVRSRGGLLVQVAGWGESWLPIVRGSPPMGRRPVGIQPRGVRQRISYPFRFL